jgi:MscS family membrane protein
MIAKTPRSKQAVATGARASRCVAPTILILALLCAAPGVAQVEGGSPAGAEGQPPGQLAPQAADPHDPRVPRGAVRSFIDACRQGDYEEAKRFLDLSPIPEEQRDEQGADLARRLKTVLDRALWIHYELLSDVAEGKLDDGLPPNLDRLEGEGDLEVLLARVVDENGELVWRFGASTVRRIPILYEQYGYGPLGAVLPSAMFEVRFLEIQLWQWIGLALLALVAWLLARILMAILRRVVRPLLDRTETKIDETLFQVLLPPLRLIAWIFLFTLGSLSLRLSVPAYSFMATLEKALVLVAITWLAVRSVDVLSALVQERLEQTDRKTATAVIPLGRRAVKVALLAFALIAVLQNLGVHVTGLIAGLGVGGLAVALAAQKTVANLFGGVSLITDQPVRVGDFCRYGGDKLGTIEEIGLRSTRVRTLDRTLVTVPNSEFSEIHIENFAVRDQIRLLAMLGLRYETTPDQLRYVLTELRQLLVAHPTVSESPARVRFVGFGAHSLDLEIFAYVLTGDWNEFLKIREDIFLRIMDIIHSAGTGFAFPSQTLYLGRDGGLKEELGRQAERHVHGWREEGTLPFPDLSPETITRLENSADWPPRGSVSAGKEA